VNSIHYGGRKPPPTPTLEYRKLANPLVAQAYSNIRKLSNPDKHDEGLESFPKLRYGTPKGILGVI